MNIADYINGTYELLGGFFLLYNCLVLYRQKQVRGISVLATVFFTSWGIWNLYYYPSLNQWVSFTGGCLIVIANTIWVSMMIYYVYKEKHLTIK